MSAKPLPEGYLSGSAILKAPAIPPAIWGSGSEVLWALGQGLLVFGPDSVGKTQLAGNLVRGFLGLRHEVLGQPVKSLETDRRILLLLMDRPQQALSSFRRMFSDDEQQLLDERVAIWRGPPPEDLAAHPERLNQMCEETDSAVVIVDSLKDASVGLSKDEIGSGWNKAVQIVIAARRQILVLHHQRKPQDGNRVPKTIHDIYGSRWLTAGMGSIICLWGDPGDPIVEMIHIKPPTSDALGPWKVEVCANGDMQLEHAADLIELATRFGPDGLTARDAAAVMFYTDNPSKAEIKKAQRKLEAKERDGLLLRRAGSRGGRSSESAARWVAADRPVAAASGRLRDTFDGAIPKQSRAIPDSAFPQVGAFPPPMTEAIPSNPADSISAGQAIPEQSREQSRQPYLYKNGDRAGSAGGDLLDWPPASKNGDRETELHSAGPALAVDPADDLFTYNLEPKEAS